MIKIVTVEEMRAIEQEADAEGLSYAEMMQRAGRALADRVLALLAEEPKARITVLVGSGNNGGDALVAANFIAAESEHEVNLYLYKPRAADDPVFAPTQEAGLFVAEAPDDQQYRVLKNMIASSQVIIDGLLGIGFKPPVKGKLAKLLSNVREAINAAHRAGPRPTYETPAAPRAMKPHWPYVIAVDCPSGLDCDTGALDKVTLPADETMTFAAIKRGQVRFPGAGVGGVLRVGDIGLPKGLPSQDRVTLEMPAAADIKARLPQLPPDAHKGTFGKTMIVAGSLNYTGAAALAARAAYRVGAGLVTVGAPGPIITTLATQIPEATWVLLPHDMGVFSEGAARVLYEEVEGYQALLLGPGWGREKTTREFLRQLLTPEAESNPTSHRIGFTPASASSNKAQSQSEDAPAKRLPALIIDADGLNLLSEIENWWEHLPPDTILTPHPGEMARLTGMARDEVQADRIGLAQEKAAAWQCIVLLKGAHTVIAAPDGRVVVLPFVEPALATAGTGDVLAGAITSLHGQGLGAFDAAIVGGYLHGLAGTLAAQTVGNRRSVMAGDVLAALSGAISAIEAGDD